MIRIKTVAGTEFPVVFNNARDVSFFYFERCTFTFHGVHYIVDSGSKLPTPRDVEMYTQTRQGENVVIK